MKAIVHVNSLYTVGSIDPRLTGSFLEHVGRAIYGGIFEPNNASNDVYGMRTDVADVIKELNTSIVRYPGGNFVSSYDWRDGIGPVENRKPSIDLAWKCLEPNLFGVDEFAKWLKLVHSKGMMVVNLGNGSMQSACQLLEYCNVSEGTRFSEMRIQNGSREPHNFRVWALGNEMDGNWQIGQKTAKQYARLASETAKAMRRIDPTIEIVVCGSTFMQSPHFPDWDLTVLEETYEHIDLLSLHSYFSRSAGDIKDYLAKSLDMASFIKSTVCACDTIKAKKRSKKQVNISFDEWNVWTNTVGEENAISGFPVSPPILQEVFTMADALMVGCLLITLLKHADRVKIACLAQLVNVLAPIMAEPSGKVWRQTTFYPFSHVSNFAKGVVLNSIIDCPAYDTKNHEKVPYLECAVTYNQENGNIVIFAVNRSDDQNIELSMDLRDFPAVSPQSHIELSHPNLDVANTMDHPSEVEPKSKPLPKRISDSLVIGLSPLSWNVITLT